MDTFSDLGSLSQFEYLLDRTNSVVDPDSRLLRLSYESTAGYFSPQLRLVHKLINLHGTVVDRQSDQI